MAVSFRHSSGSTLFYKKACATHTSACIFARLCIIVLKQLPRRVPRHCKAYPAMNSRSSSPNSWNPFVNLWSSFWFWLPKRASSSWTSRATQKIWSQKSYSKFHLYIPGLLNSAVFSSRQVAVIRGPGLKKRCATTASGLHDSTTPVLLSLGQAQLPKLNKDIVRLKMVP